MSLRPRPIVAHVAALAFATGLALGAPAARAQAVPGQDVARRLFEEGVALEGQKAWADALQKFVDAEQIKSTPAIRFHKAFCLEGQGKLAAALDEYEAAERGALEQNKAETLRSTRDRLKGLRPRVPFLAVKAVSPPGTEVLLDGARLGAPLVQSGTKFRIDPGEHVLVARANDFQTKQIKVELAEGAERSVSVELERNPVVTAAVKPTKTESTKTEPTKTEPTKAEPHATATEPPPELGTRRSLALPIATTAGAVVLAAGGVVAFVLAGNAADDAEGICATKISCDGQRAKVRTLDGVALGGFVSGALLGGLATYLWLSGPSPRAGSAASPRTGPRLRVGPTGIALEGTL